MRFTRYIITAALALLFCQFTLPAWGQLGFSLDLKKPKEFEERTLRSERSDQKKFTLPRRFVQNTVTHYNYFFNANNKLNEIIDRAKLSLPLFSLKDGYGQIGSGDHAEAVEKSLQTAGNE